MKISNDKFEDSKLRNSVYDEFFDQLTRENNCVVCDDERELSRVDAALRGWLERKCWVGYKVTARRKNRDGLPRVWLIYPDASKKAPTAKPVTLDSPIETAPRGNWPFGRQEQK